MTQTAVEYEFTCPDCGASIDVNASMRDALLDHGCVLCSASVTDDDFESVE